MIRGILVMILYMAYRVTNIAMWVYVLASWFVRPGSPMWYYYCKLAGLIEPFLSPIRDLLRNFTYKIGIDFSPYIFMLLLSVVYKALVSFLFMF